jgi:rod shape determining protein RodA
MASTFRSFRDLDWTLLIITLVLCGLGVLQIYSATLDTVWKDAWWKQLVFVAAGVAILLAVARTDYHYFLGRVPWMYVISIALLLVTFAIGTKVFGSRRWIPLFGMTFQVSEFVKIVLILVVARYLTDLRSEYLEGRDLLRLGILFGIPMVMVMKQPDLGTSLTYLPILAGCIFVAGLRWQHLAILCLAAAIALPASWFLLKDYQRARLITFVDPESDPRGDGYQVIQSKIAVGQGGVWGRGVTQGSQTQLRFLPVPHTDFLFAAFAEEHGFVGVVVALGLYFLLLMRIIQNAQMASDRAGLLICVGVAALLLFHLFVNVGMVVGRMPVTGIPLPLMSSGGSSLLSVFIMLGLVQSVRLRRFVN